MMRVLFAACVLLVTDVIAYHDTDLNYHLSQVQKLQDCGDGYSYPAPQVQLTTSGVKLAGPAQTIVSQPILQSASYSHSNAGDFSGVSYQASLPKITYAAPQQTYGAPQQAYIAPQQITNYISNPNLISSRSYSSQREVHGYATSAGLSTYTASNGRTVIPQATYAQAPIIAKVTAAPLIAKYSVAPVKTTFFSQNLISQQAAFASGSAAKASLNSYSVQSGGPVVSQVYAAPTASQYTTAQALRAQGPQLFTPQNEVQDVPAAVTKFVGPSPVQYSGQYSAPALGQYSAPVVTQYSAPVVNQHVAPVQYSAPVHYSAPVTQYSHAFVPPPAPVLAHVPGQYAHSASGVVAKNVHTDFLENYDAHPRYAYEYNVNDPHTGDIKHQKEQRDGEVVKGQYSLVEPDGSVRTVDYFADWETGFHANVRNSKDQH